MTAAISSLSKGLAFGRTRKDLAQDIRPCARRIPLVARGHEARTHCAAHKMGLAAVPDPLHCSAARKMPRSSENLRTVLNSRPAWFGS